MESTYRQNTRNEPRACARCGSMVMPDRMVYATTGELVCAGCEVSDDSTLKLRRGARAAAWAACGLGAIGAVALIFLLGAVAEAGVAHSRIAVRGSAMMMCLLALFVFIGVSSIVGSLRTLKGPAVVAALEGRTGKLVLLSLSGIVIGPFMLGLWTVVLSLH